jgi:hypothetical protein
MFQVVPRILCMKVSSGNRPCFVLVYVCVYQVFQIDLDGRYTVFISRHQIFHQMIQCPVEVASQYNLQVRSCLFLMD